MARAILSCLGLGVAAATLTASGNPVLAVAAGTAAGGIAGNLGTDLFKALDRRAAERFLQGWSGIDENHHVAEALRLAQIKALRAVLKRFDDARKTDADPFRKDRDDRFSAALSRFLDEETRLAQRAFARDAAAPDEQAVRAAVLSRLPEALDQSLAARRAGGERQAIAESVSQMRGAVEAAVLAEVRLRTVPAEAALPPFFEAAFKGMGFIDAWFDLFVRDAAAWLKENDAFERIWVAEQTALINAIVAAHDAVLGRIDARTERIETQQKIASAKLDEMLALLRASGTVEKAAAQGISEPAVRAIVVRLGGERIARDDLVPWLDTWIEEARQALSRTSNEGEAFETARREAERRFRAGRLTDASAAFMEEIAREDRVEHKRQEERKRRRIQLLEEAVRFDELALATDAAVQKLRMIAEAEEAKSPDALVSWLSGQAHKFYERGRDEGRNGALLLSISVYRAALEEWTRERVPLDWAMRQNKLGAALQTLGERESGTARLDEAVAAYTAALEEWTRERMPLQWTATQNNLSNVFLTLGRREDGTARLDQAVIAYREALEEWTRKRVPLDWAMAQHNLGAALYSLSERESGTARLVEAVAAYRAALEERTRERVPLDWAMTQHNLGAALQSLSEREIGTTWLAEAIAAYGAAMEEWTRERVPFYWASTQNNLGTALYTLGEREIGTVRLREAIAAFRAALEERTRECVPLRWAMTQRSLSEALYALGTRESSTERLEEAVEAYRAALEVFTPVDTPHNYADAIAALNHTLAEIDSGPAATSSPRST